MTNELDVWEYRTPVVASGNPEFEAWLYRVPVVDIGIGGTTEELGGSGRIGGIGNSRRTVFLW